jgi:hypothetical protein
MYVVNDQIILEILVLHPVFELFTTCLQVARQAIRHYKFCISAALQVEVPVKKKCS